MAKHDKRVALVTGANRGIGYAIAKGLAERGITTVLAVRDPGKAEAACSRLQGQGLNAYFELLDVTDMGGKQAPLTAEKGANTPLWLATLPDGGPSGGFFSEREQIPW